jgi:hypothetical protein
VATLSEVTEIRVGGWNLSKIDRVEATLGQFPPTESAKTTLHSPDKPGVASTSKMCGK